MFCLLTDDKLQPICFFLFLDRFLHVFKSPDGVFEVNVVHFLAYAHYELSRATSCIDVSRHQHMEPKNFNAMSILYALILIKYT